MKIKKAHLTLKIVLPKKIIMWGTVTFSTMEFSNIRLKCSYYMLSSFLFFNKNFKKRKVIFSKIELESKYLKNEFCKLQKLKYAKIGSFYF